MLFTTEQPAMSKEMAMRCAFDMAGIKSPEKGAAKPKDWSPYQAICALEVLALEIMRLQALPPVAETLEQKIKEMDADVKRMEHLLGKAEAGYNWALWAFLDIRTMAESAKATAAAAVTTVPAVTDKLDKIIDKTMDIYKPAKHVLPADAGAAAKKGGA